MPRLVEGLSRFFGRVEILALGLENERREAEAALARGLPLEAREHARTIVASLPDSPLGLALWADAAEDAWLPHEVVTALSELAKRVPWRADVWLRLGRAGLRTEWPGAREALERATVATDERESARLALLDLADLDLAAGDAARAQRWLDRIAPSIEGTVDRDLALRRAESALARGDADAAARSIAVLGSAESDAPIDGRIAAARARLALAQGDLHAAFDLALRAYLLSAEAAGEAGPDASADLLASVVAGTHDAVLVERARVVVRAAGAIDEPAWAAAFALAEGRRDDARRALARGLQGGDLRAATALLGLAIETRDLDALDAVAARDPSALAPPLARLREAAALAHEDRADEALDRLDDVSGDASAWASELRASIVARWLPPLDRSASKTAWAEVLRELRRTARALDRLDVTSAIEALAVERERPLRVAVVGEFNAGKSTFLNALLGEDVAPTGILPTTATLHWVAWAPDPFARIVLRGAPDRVIAHRELKATLAELTAPPSSDHEGEAKPIVERVFIYAPIERLKRIEILDTPGFNAPDPEHLAAARSAFDEAHVAIWLLDATGPFKETERRVLAEIKALGVPVQILANKADRLKPEALAAVMEHVHESLRAVGFAPSEGGDASDDLAAREPVAFSARLALRGKLGDAAALEASNWAAVERAFTESIVDRSERLRERALRRKAAKLAAALVVAAQAKADEEREAARSARERAESLRAAAALLRRERESVTVAVDRSIEPARRLLAADLKPLGAIAEERQRSDAGLRAYLRERFVSRLADPITRALAERAGVAPPANAAASVRAVLLGVASAHELPAALLEKPLDRILDACLEAFSSGLGSAAEEAGDRASPSLSLATRAEAVRAALG